MIVQLFILALMLLVVPTFVGGLAVGASSESIKGKWNLPFRWVSGQFFLWAGFQLICVPLILMGRKFTDVVILFSGYTAALFLFALAVWIRRRAKGSLRLVGGTVREKRGESLILWAVFGILLAFQLIQAVRMAYWDGDDAFYVAVSTITDEAETMYQKMPYTGGATAGLDVRHGLAPFPIWIAYLARISGMPAVSVAHVVLPVMLISMTYAIFYLLGCRLFPGRDARLPLFMVFTEILVLFGDYSFQSVENFMMARSRQGKAALGSIVIPFVLYLLFLLYQKIKEMQKVPPMLFLVLASAAVTGCLCSTLGALIVCMLMGIVGLIAAFGNRRWAVFLTLGACCLPCMGCAFIYLISK